MRSHLFAAVLLASAMAGAVLAQSAPAAAPAAPQATTPAATATPAVSKLNKHGYDPNVVICKWTEELGTRLGGGKTCMTRLQWDQLARDSEDEVNSTDERSNNMGLPTK